MLLVGVICVGLCFVRVFRVLLCVWGLVIDLMFTFMVLV